MTTSATTDNHHIDHLNAQAAAAEENDLVAAYELATRAFQASRASSYSKGTVEALLTLASVDERRGAYKDSIRHASEGLVLAQGTGLIAQRCSLYYVLTWNYYNLGDYPKATETALRQLKVAEEQHYRKGEAEAHNSLGAIYSAVEDELNPLHSIAHYECSLSIYRELGLEEREAVLLNNLCVTCETAERYPEALSYGTRALEISRRLGHTQSEMLILGNLGIVHSKLGDWQQARDHYHLRLALTRSQGYRPLETHTLLSLGRLHLRLEAVPLALEYFQQALALADEFGYRKWIFEAHFALSQAFEKQGNFQDALHHYKQYHEVEQRVLNEQSRTEIERFRISYDVEKMEDDLRRERQQREQDRRYFEQMDALKSEFISTASHDLKNPLSSIFINLTLLQRHLRDAPDQVRVHLERLEKDATRMRNLIHQLLDKAMVETGRGLNCQSVNLLLLIEAVLEEVQPLLQSRQQRIDLAVPSSLMITVDAERMKQVLHNLLSNAMKYTPSTGQISIRAEAAENAVLIRIEDTGIGIPADALPHLFKPFYRVKHSQHQRVEGTGLGLSIVQTIIQQHAGTIEVISAEGGGSTFIIRLPDVVPTAELTVETG